MNILTDEELNSIKDNHRDQLVELDLLRNVESALLSKLAEQAGEPVAYITYKGHLLHANDPKVSDHSDPEPLYTEAQLIAAQQRTAEACAALVLNLDGDDGFDAYNVAQSIRKNWREYQ